MVLGFFRGIKPNDIERLCSEIWSVVMEVDNPIVCVWKPEEALGVLPQMLSILFLSQGFSLTWNSPKCQGWLVSEAQELA